MEGAPEEPWDTVQGEEGKHLLEVFLSDSDPNLGSKSRGRIN